MQNMSIWKKFSSHILLLSILFKKNKNQQKTCIRIFIYLYTYIKEHIYINIIYRIFIKCFQQSYKFYFVYYIYLKKWNGSRVLYFSFVCDKYKNALKNLHIVKIYQKKVIPFIWIYGKMYYNIFLVILCFCFIYYMVYIIYILTNINANNYIKI